MRTTALTTALLLTVLFFTACKSAITCDPCPCAGINQGKGVYRHVVVFKFKQTATPEQINEIVEDFAGLQNQIDAITGFEHGVNVSPEGLDQGFTHVFLVSFKDKAGLEQYLPHPAHKTFVEQLRPLLEEPFVVDYVAQ